MSGLRICVTGGRELRETDFVFRCLDEVHRTSPISELAHGGALGADHSAMLWALARGVPTAVFEADWARFGRKAGPVRNEAMLRVFQPDLLVAFPGGAGTTHCCAAATRRGVPIRRFELPRGR